MVVVRDQFKNGYRSHVLQTSNDRNVSDKQKDALMVQKSTIKQKWNRDKQMKVSV